MFGLPKLNIISMEADTVTHVDWGEVFCKYVNMLSAVLFSYRQAPLYLF